MKGSKEMDSGKKPEERAVVGQLLAEDYATVVENPAARLLFSELIADVLHAAHAIGQEAGAVLNRAVRIYGRDGGVIDIGGEREARIAVEAADPPVEEKPPVESSAVWEEPPHEPPAVPHWEEPPDLSTINRGRFARFETDMRANPNRWLVLAENVSSSYISGVRKQHGADFEFQHKRMRRTDKRSYKVWSRYIGKPNLKCHREEEAG